MIRDFSWDDIRFFLAVCRGGSLPRAAEQLGVSEGTVSRRIAGMEKRLAARLFDRHSTGHALTDLGREVEAVAARIDSEVHAFCRIVEGQDQNLAGSLVVTVSPALLTEWLLPLIEEFTKANPQISLELRETDNFENLHQRSADVAIRVTNEPPPGLVGRKVMRLSFATYATRAVAEDPGARWIGWVDRTGEADWLEGPFADRHVGHRVSGAISSFEAAKHGLGIARLECHMADREPSLVRIDKAYFERWIWLLTHEGLRRNARVRAFQDFMYERMLADKERIESDATEFRHL